MFGIVYKIGHDEEIVGKSHFFDHVQFIFQLLAAFRAVRIALGKPYAAKSYPSGSWNSGR